MVEKYCKKCKRRTEHNTHGFEYYNRRYSCIECGFEYWDGKTEMEAPIE